MGGFPCWLWLGSGFLPLFSGSPSVFAPVRFLLNRRTGCLVRWPAQVLALVCLVFLALTVAPPAANQTASPGARGPSMEKAALLLAEQLPHRESEASAGPADLPGLRIPESAEAWKHLPVLEQGRATALPGWARVLAKTLPHTTAALLELDYLHRARGPLEPILRGQLRWVAAHANRCRYSEACAAADLRRAGMDEAGIQALAGDLAILPPRTRTALQFAHRLSRDGRSVTDAEVEQLIALFGERQVVGMVLLLAYANFQDRLVLSLGLPPEADGPLPPLPVRFALAARGQSGGAGAPGYPGR